MADLALLRARLEELAPVVVAFSGGADSAFLAWVANDTLGSERAVAMTAVSPSLAADELDDCRALVDEWGLRWEPVVTDELANPAYSANDGQRCYYGTYTAYNGVRTLPAAIARDHRIAEPARQRCMAAEGFHVMAAA